MDRMSVYDFPAKEEPAGAGQVHQPGYCQAPPDADEKRGEQEDEARGVELHVGDKPLA